MVMVRDIFRLDIFSGHLFVFFSKRRDRVRTIYWDRDGIAMWTKRLERGRYRVQRCDVAIRAIDAAELSLILEGIDLERVRRRPRWTPRPVK
jgi:transposase